MDQELRAYLNEFREIAINIDKHIDAADDRERQTRVNADAITRTHRDGWQQVARAIERGFELVAGAIRDRR